MKKRIVRIADLQVFLIGSAMLACFSWVYPSQGPAAELSLLADKHKSAGIDCESCHQEKPPGKPVPMEICLGCHGGDFAKLADQTKKVAPNPHDSHLGNVPCEFCHHLHRPSEFYCSKCHLLDSKVP